MARRFGPDGGGIGVQAGWRGRAWVAPAAFALAWLAALEPAAACLDGAAERVAVAAVEPGLVLRLGDGRRLRLAGLDPALPTPEAPDRDETSQRAFAALIGAGPLAIRLLSAVPDRWGRLVGSAEALSGPGAGVAGGLAGAAIGAGLGRYRAEPLAHACRSIYVGAEDTARAAKLGLWADPYYAVLAVDDRAAFAERTGSVVIVEGRLQSVMQGPSRTRLTFAAKNAGSHGGQVLSATLSPRVMKLFEAYGLHLSHLVGRALRLRGLLDLRFGPQIELAGPDDVDILDPAGAASAAVAPGSK